MTIQSLTSNNITQPMFAQSIVGLPLAQQKQLTPEESNNLNKAAEDQAQQKKDRIQGTYDTARNVDLARNHYEHQQAVINAYTQTTQGSTSHSSVSSDSAVKSLTEMYAALYEYHQNETVLPVKTLPDNQGEAISLDKLKPVDNQYAQNHLQAYNDVMKPSTSSYMNLSA